MSEVGHIPHQVALLIVDGSVLRSYTYNITIPFSKFKTHTLKNKQHSQAGTHNQYFHVMKKLSQCKIKTFYTHHHKMHHHKMNSDIWGQKGHGCQIKSSFGNQLHYKIALFNNEYFTNIKSLRQNFRTTLRHTYVDQLHN